VVHMKDENRLSASLEDYLEAIYHCRDANNAVRSKMIQKRLAVSGASVTEACQQLREKGLVNYAPYEAITLTPLGESCALEVVFRHETLRDFFIEVLKVDPDIADEGACKMEHVVSTAIVDRMIKYTRYLRLKNTIASVSKEKSFTSFLKSSNNQ
jgi:DtxR family transcriptional regulator, Mn-dependent transcriptional regulator